MGTNLISAKLIDFSNDYLAHGVITVCTLCAIMLFANVLRRKIKILRRSYLPTTVIAGLVGLLIKEVVFAITKSINGEGFNIFSVYTLEGIVFHSLSLGFIALCLRDKDEYAKDFDKNDAKKERVSSFKSGSVIVSTYLFQGLIGIIIAGVLSFTFIQLLNPGTGIILALGFGQGPGQASSIGGSWDVLGYMDAFGEGEGMARNFGLTIAAFGFLWAAIPGIILVNRIAKKKGMTLLRDEYQKSGDVQSYMVEGAEEVPLSESIDKFSLQICMVGGVYLVTLGLVVLIEVLCNLSGQAFLINMVPTIWGFSFMLSVLVASLVKMVMKRLFRANIMHRKYPNSYMMNRISGAAFDISTAAALCLISVSTLGILWVPVALMSTAAGIGTAFYVRFLTRRVYKDYPDEAFLAMYGMLTGTIGNGMILLREVDAHFKTPAADDLVKGSSAGIALGFPLFVLIPIAVANGGKNVWWVGIILLVYMMGLITYMLGWHKKLFKGKNPPTNQGDDHTTDDSPQTATNE